MENKNKNLLAFSGGVDSTALFFMLLGDNTKFDVAIVDYGQRVQSKEEVLYAKQLCRLYNKKCFVKEFPADIKFSEKSARDFRYEFFEYLISFKNYDNLYTAHQLNDKFEWFLMQLGRGAGLAELIGLQEKESRDNYTLRRPLLNHTKEELIKYLDEREIKYFIDQSNFNPKYTRNHIRASFSDKFIDQYSQGLKRSFNYLDKDKESLLSNIHTYTKDDLVVYDFITDDNIAIRLIDKELKKRGLVISRATRDEILEQREIIISDKIAIAITSSQIWIAPKCDIAMNKEFKEKCRINKIPKNIRSYISTIDYFLWN